MSDETGVRIFRSLRHHEDLCTGCMTCMRACPTQAIRMRHGLPLVIEDRCMDCGECIRTCPEKAFRPKCNSIADLEKFKYLIAIPGAAQLVQFGHDIGPERIIEALGTLGFDEVVPLSEGCALYMTALARLLISGQGKHPIIVTHCPSVVRLVRIYHPGLVEHLAPLRSPRELTARMARADAAKRTGLCPDEIGVVYITPCSAKVIDLEALDDDGNRFIDAAIPIAEIHRDLLAALSRLGPPSDQSTDFPRISVGCAFVGGISRNQRRLTMAMESALPQDEVRISGDELDLLPVSQIRMVRNVLNALEQGRLDHVDLLECMACPEGCVGGSLVVDDPYLARAKAIKLLRASPPPDEVIDLKAALEKRWQVELSPSETLGPLPPPPLDTNLMRSIAKMKKKEELIRSFPGLDCGLCGAPTCADLADDLVRERPDSGECVVLIATQPDHAKQGGHDDPQ